MAAFSHNHQQQHNNHDSVFLPNMSFSNKISVDFLDQNAFFLSFHDDQGSIPAPVAADPLITILNYETSELQTINKHCTEPPPLSSVVDHYKAESATATVGDHFTQNSVASATSMANKRKISDGSSSSLSSAHSKAVSESVKGKKQKKGGNGGEEKAKKVHMGSKKKEEGYIHVRARRGQATDSHSLAERIRREKISEKMKQLQALVPGCDKVTGKALMLDEIINYLQSLQHQVEFLSMKLSSFNPMFYDFGTDLDAFMLVPNEGMSSFMSNVQHCKSPNFNDSTRTSTLATPNNNFPILDPSSRLFQQQMPSALFQDNGQLLWPDIDEQRQRLIGLSGFMANNNLGSFH